MQTEDIFVNRTYDGILTPAVPDILGTTFSNVGNTLLAEYILGKEMLAVTNILSSFAFLFYFVGILSKKCFEA